MLLIDLSYITIYCVRVWTFVASFVLRVVCLCPVLFGVCVCVCVYTNKALSVHIRNCASIVCMTVLVFNFVCVVLSACADGLSGSSIVPVK